MKSVENLISVLAIIMGAVTLSASRIFAVLLSRRAKGRSSGKLASLPNGPRKLILTIILVSMGFILWKPVPVNISEQFHFSLTIFGAVFYLWGLGTLRSQFAVSNLFGAELYKEHKLVTNGPFAIVRHPLYVGIILTAVGALLIFRTWAMVIFSPMSFVVIGRAEREERLLAEEFGEEWKVYLSKVPKWLPKIW